MAIAILLIFIITTLVQYNIISYTTPTRACAFPQSFPYVPNVPLNTRARARVRGAGVISE